VRLSRTPPSRPADRRNRSVHGAFCAPGPKTKNAPQRQLRGVMVRISCDKWLPGVDGNANFIVTLSRSGGGPPRKGRG